MPRSESRPGYKVLLGVAIFFGVMAPANYVVGGINLILGSMLGWVSIVLGLYTQVLSTIYWIRAIEYRKRGTTK